MNFDHFLLELLVFDLNQLLKLFYLVFVLEFDALEGLDEFFEDIDQRFGLFVVLDVRFFAVLVHFHLVVEHLPELVVFVDEHFHFILYLLGIGVVGVAVEFLDGLGEFGINPDQLLKRLLEDVVFFLQFCVAFFEFFVLALSCEVVLEPVSHPDLI